MRKRFLDNEIDEMVYCLIEEEKSISFIANKYYCTPEEVSIIIGKKLDEYKTNIEYRKKIELHKTQKLSLFYYSEIDRYLLFLDSEECIFLEDTKRNRIVQEINRIQELLKQLQRPPIQ